MRKILLIDNSPDEAERIGSLLQNDELAIEWCDSSAQAIQALATGGQEFAAAIIRMEPPGPFVAFELLVQCQQALPGAPVIIVSSALDALLAAPPFKHEARDSLEIPLDEAEQADLEVLATAAYIFQQAHRLNNAIQTLYRLAQAIKQEKTENARQMKIDKLMAKAHEYTETIDLTIDKGERIHNPARERQPIYELVEKSLAEVDSGKWGTTRIHFTLVDNLVVVGSADLLKELFRILLDNAFAAMGAKKYQAGEEPTLKISGANSSAKFVEIAFEDNGVGMTADEIRKAERGLAANGYHKGKGVLISKVIARAQHGSLRYESEKGKGTKAILTLHRAAAAESHYYPGLAGQPCAKSS
jgi:signal transduction histidine kinase